MRRPCDVTVVLSTYNRAELLRGALESLASQQAGDVPFEVLVVDNNSTDDTPAVVDAFVRRGAPMRYLFEGQQGLSYAWNTAIQQAAGAIIALTDDDIHVAPDWVATIKRAFDEHPEVAFMGGKVLPLWESPPPRWLTDVHWSPLALTNHGDQQFHVNADRPICLLGKAFRRAAFDKVGLFKPELGRIKDAIGSTEDHDLQMRLWQAGLQGLYNPELVMYSPVEARRLTKAYHRRWHFGHGKFCALMQLAELTGSRGELLREPLEGVKLWGTPLFFLPECLRLGRRWARARLSRDEATSFWCENEVRYRLGYASKRYEVHGPTGPVAALRDIVAVANAFRRRRARSGERRAPTGSRYDRSTPPSAGGSK